MQTSSAELKLHAETARDLMTLSPYSICHNTTVKDAARFLLENSISGVPVIDERGRPVGVLSQTDIVRHVREHVEHPPGGAYYHQLRLRTEAGEALGTGFQVETEDVTPVSQIMMPLVFAVPQEAPVAMVIGLMLTENIHRVFVTDNDNTLVGVISGFDILSKLMA